MASARQRARQTPPRQTRAYHRRQEQAREARFQRRVTIVVVAVLAVVGILVGAGYLLTTYLPAHAQVLAVGDRRFNAQTVAVRAAFLALTSEPDVASAIQGDPVGGTLDAITRTETLLQVGASEVEAIGDDEFEAALRKRIGVGADASAAEKAEVYGRYLRTIPISRAVFESEVRATVIAEKLAAKFRATLPETAAQVNLLSAQSADQPRLQAVLDAVKGGAPFDQAVVNAGVAPQVADVTDGWVPLDALSEGKDTVAALQADQTSDLAPLENGNWALYHVTERDEDRPLDDAQKDRLAKVRLASWVSEQHDALGVTRDVPPAREAWILKEMQKAVRGMQAELLRQSEARQAGR